MRLAPCSNMNRADLTEVSATLLWLHLPSRNYETFYVRAWREINPKRSCPTCPTHDKTRSDSLALQKETMVQGGEASPVAAQRTEEIGYRGAITMDSTTRPNPPLPRKLYKYRRFDLFALRMLTTSKVYFSDPTQFNDPLDCKPELSVDIDIVSLEHLLMRMTPESSRLLRNCRETANFFVEPEEQTDHYFSAVVSSVKETLFLKMGKIGVLSLAESWNCPLMWSHYGDQHKGICLCFNSSRTSGVAVKKVDYEGTRCVKCSDLMSCYVDGNTEALERIKETFFFTKANDWKYEREWRVTNGKSGDEESSPFELTEVYFGMRCDDAVKTAVLNLKHSPELDYYEISPEPGDFKLCAREINAEDKQWYMPRSSARVAFGLISATYDSA